MISYEVIIIGAGISGITCALYLKRAGIKVLLLENGIPGGQLNKASVIENYPGYLAVNGSDLAFSLLEQVTNNDIDIVYDNIKSISYDKKEIEIESAKYSYKYLVFATGRREKLLGIKNEDKLIGKGVSLCATCDGALYKGKDVVVVGGGNSALSEAIYLANICKRVYLIYRGNEFRGDKILQEKLVMLENVSVIRNSNIIEYLVDDDKLVGVKLDNNNRIDIEGVFLAIGSIPNSELFNGDKNNGYIIVDKYGESSIKDVYACGDVIEKDIYQLVTASNEGVVVASSIIKKLEVWCEEI